MDKKDDTRRIRVPDDIYTDVQKKAKSSGLTFSSYVRLLIIKDLKKKS